MILLHILIALASVGYSTYAFFSPSQAKLNASYGLVAATLLSGTYLVVATHAALVASCTTGLIYTGAVSILLAAAHYKLAKTPTK